MMFHCTHQNQAGHITDEVQQTPKQFSQVVLCAKTNQTHQTPILVETLTNLCDCVNDLLLFWKNHPQRLFLCWSIICSPFCLCFVFV